MKRIELMRFFDRYPRFYETTATRLLPNRLHQRWRIIIEHNLEMLRGARVLDLASHDGRWSFAALEAGAVQVTGVEGRPELCERAEQNFKHYGVAADRYRFMAGDVAAFLGSQSDAFDVALNLGFFYHTMKHLEVLEGCARSGVGAMILDTAVIVEAAPMIALSWDDSSDLRHAIDHFGAGMSKAPVGRPSRAALAMMLAYVGYDCTELSWAECNDFSECEDYQRGLRATFLARRSAGRDR